MDRPRLKGHFAVEVVGDSRVFLLSEDRQGLLQGEAAVALLPYLDGTNTNAEIVGALGSRFSVGQILTALRKYEMLGYLADGRPDLTPGELAYYDGMGVDPAAAVSARDAGRVAVVGAGAAEVGPFVSALRAAGLQPRHVDPGDVGSADLVLVTVDDYLTPDLGDLNRRFLETGTRWVLTKPHGLITWIGPLFEPGSTGCWECLRQRVDGNRQVERYLLGKKDTDVPFSTSRAASPADEALVSGVLATETISILATGTSPRLAGTLLTFDRRTLTTETHSLIRRPQCPACGHPRLISERDPRIELTARPVRFRTDGGFRVEPPEQTAERLSRHVSPFLGAISRVQPLSEGADGITYSYSAGHNFAVVGDNLALLRRNLRGQSGGKGRTEAQAKGSAMAEAIERYSGVWRGDEPVRRATFEELASEPVVHMSEILLFSDQQYANRTAWNAHEAGRLHVVPDPFRTDVPVDWTPAWSLTKEQVTYVPAAHVWFGHPDLADHFFTFADANGNAAGSVLEEAMLQGLFELIERDAVAIWWYNRLRLPRFDLDSLDEPYVTSLRRHYATLDRELWVLDLTTDLGIPAFAAVSARTSGATEDILLGFGSHLDPRLAAMRALTEMNQFLPALSRRHPDGSTDYWEDDPDTLRWWRTARLAEEPWLRPDPRGAVRATGDHMRASGADLRADVQYVLDRLHRSGLEVLAVDQSRPDLDLAVAKVIVPGLRHFWRRLGPGRLYDVPVELGHLAAPLREDELNPKSVFF